MQSNRDSGAGDDERIGDYPFLWHKCILPKDNTLTYKELMVQVGYEVGDVIAKGSFSKLRLTRRTKDNLLQVAKTIDASESEQHRTYSRFLRREVEIQSQMDHPNIAKIYNVFEFGTKIFIVMDYVSGGDLMDYIEVHSHLNEQIVKNLFKQLASALKYCHDKCIAHRDIKCDNILIDDDGIHIKLADFGFARYCYEGNEIHKRCLSCTFCGSLPYSAPEIAQRISYDPIKSDIWSLGVVLFIMINKTFPFYDRDFDVMLNKIKTGQYRHNDRVRTISDLVKDLVAALLKVCPEERFNVDQVIDHPWMSIIDQ
ncbi:hypothetical protein ACOME3_003946 [Neoechinorhynchus agilis]